MNAKLEAKPDVKPEVKEDPYKAAPDNYPEKGSSGSGSDTAYSVEARLAYHEPRTIVGQIFDTRWRTVQFQQHPMGVPTQRSYSAWGGGLPHLMKYQAAQALRWWFLAQADHDFSCLCVETRLVEHRIEYSYGETSVRAGAEIGGDDRSNIMFGWRDANSAAR